MTSYQVRSRAGALALVMLSGVDPSHARPVEARAQAASAEHAADAGSAKEAFDRGLAFARQERFREAIDAFETAYRLRPHYSVLYNISQSYSRLGDLEHAVLYLERYLEEGALDIPEPQHAAREQQLIMLKRELDQTSRAQTADSAPLTVQCDLPQVQAWVDGVLHAGAFPATFRLSPGGHSLEFRRPGYVTDTHELALTGAALSVSCVETVPLKPTTASKPLVPAPPSSSEPRPEATDAATSPPTLVVAYATAATGLVLVAASAGILVWNGQREEEWKQTDSELDAFRTCSPNCSPPVPEDFNARQTANNDLSDSIERFDIIALSSGIAGLALVGVGVYLTTQRHEAAVPSTEVSLAAGVLRVTHSW